MVEIRMPIWLVVPLIFVLTVKAADDWTDLWSRWQAGDLFNVHETEGS